MTPVTIFAKTTRNYLGVAVSFDGDGQVTEVRVAYAPSNSLRNAWRMVKVGGLVGSNAIKAAREVRDAYVRFYATHEYEKPLAYVRNGLAFEACAAFTLRCTPAEWAAWLAAKGAESDNCVKNALNIRPHVHEQLVGSNAAPAAVELLYSLTHEEFMQRWKQAAHSVAVMAHDLQLKNT